jgi:hypothetical protein
MQSMLFMYVTQSKITTKSQVNEGTITFEGHCSGEEVLDTV